MSSAAKCTICQRSIGNSWYVSDIGDVFCASHTNPTFCHGCRRPLSLGETGDTCKACIPTLFTDESQIAGSQHSVLTWLTRHIGPNGLHNVPVELEDRHNFIESQTGVTNWQYDGRNFDVGIQILRNVTPNTFEHTLAHEYGHVLLVVEPDTMMFRGGLPDHRHVEEEGFCEVVKYLWLQECGTGHREFDQRDMRDNPDPVYGDGFRLVWKEYEKLGSITALRAHMLGISTAPPKKRVLDFLRPKPSPELTPDTTMPEVSVPEVVPVAPVPSEGGSHRPTRDITFKNRHQPTPPVEPIEAPRPMVTVNFTKRTSTTDEPPVPVTSDRPMRTIKRPQRD